jgi:hypothetical protein
MSINITGGDGLENQEIREFSEEEIKRIRENDPNAEICKVVFNKVERILTMKEVKSALSTIRSMFETSRKEDPDRDDDTIRTEIRQKSKVAEEMASNSHPKLFEAVTSRESTPEDFRMIMFNINLREQVEDNKLTEEEAMAKLYAELIRKSKEENEGKPSTENGTQKT